MDNLPLLHLKNEFATGLRAASQATNTNRIKSRHTITSQQGTREYDKLVRQNCKPRPYSNTLLKHLAPLWATGTHKWSTILTTTRLSTSNPQIHIRNTKAIIARLPNKGQYASDLQLRTSIETPLEQHFFSRQTPHIANYPKTLHNRLPLSKRRKWTRPQQVRQNQPIRRRHTHLLYTIQHRLETSVGGGIASNHHP